MTGHLLGGSGGIEAVACILSLTHNFIPPTINYVNPDPDCDLDYVPNTAREAQVGVLFLILSGLVVTMFALLSAK